MLSRYVSQFMAFLLISLMILSISACGGGGGGGDDGTTVTLGSVEALFSNNGAGWNDYVQGDITNATDTACVAATGTACVHGGEARAVAVNGKSSCAGLTATDALGAFDWSCDATSGTAVMVSTGLANGVYLSGLIDFATPAWKDNSVTVLAGASEIGVTNSSAWWANPVVVDNDGGYLDTAGTIYTVTADNSNDYIINASSVALVSKDGVTISNTVSADGSGALEARDFLSIENIIVNATGIPYGVDLDTVRFSTLRSLIANSATSFGVYLYTSSNNTLTDITASNNNYSGVELNTSSNNNTLTNITASNNGYGVDLDSSSNNTLTNITASNNTNSGVELFSSSNNNTLTNITASNNGTGVSLDTSSDNTLTGITASNNTSHGIYLLSSSNNNTLTNITASNNTGNGVYLTSFSNNNTLTDITASNNGAGVVLSTSSNNTLTDITASNNTNYGVFFNGSSNNYFTGELKVGNNVTNNCFVSSGTNPGLVATTCANNGSSDATLTTGVSVTVASSFVGKVTTDDTVNTSDTNGTATYSAALDWSNFENPYRAWGLDDINDFPHANHQGRWTVGTGRIWDWSMQSSDTVLVNSVSYPDKGGIANTITHQWTAADATACGLIDGATWGAVCDLPGYNDQTSCEAATTPTGFGDWITSKCYSVLLRGAVEIHDDAIGNDNTLCESDETCLWTRNMGSYQGHGALISAGSFTDGAVLTGITLKKYETNGY